MRTPVTDNNTITRELEQKVPHVRVTNTSLIPHTSTISTLEDYILNILEEATKRVVYDFTAIETDLHSIEKTKQHLVVCVAEANLEGSEDPVDYHLLLTGRLEEDPEMKNYRYVFEIESCRILNRKRDKRWFKGTVFDVNKDPEECYSRKGADEQDEDLLSAILDRED